MQFSESGAHGVAGADSVEQDQVALLQAALRNRITSAERERARSGVAEAIDVHQASFGPDAEAVVVGGDDA
jgi:hypothetical protein